MNVAVKTEALSIFALLLSAPGGFLPLDKDLSWMTQGDHHHHSRKRKPVRRVAERARPKINHRPFSDTPWHSVHAVVAQNLQIQFANLIPTSFLTATISFTPLMSSRTAVPSA